MTKFFAALLAITLFSASSMANTVLACKHSKTLDGGDYESEYTFEFKEHPYLTIHQNESEVTTVNVGAMSYQSENIVSVDVGNEKGEMVVIVSGQVPAIPQIEIIVAKNGKSAAVNRITDTDIQAIAKFSKCTLTEE